MEAEKKTREEALLLLIARGRSRQEAEFMLDQADIIKALKKADGR